MAVLSIASLLRLGVAPQNVLILTDSPALFEKMGIGCMPFDRDQINEWEGPLKYPLRCKIKLCIELRERFPKRRIIFCDADTFWKNPPPADSSLVFLHQYEPWVSDASLGEYYSIVESIALRRSGMFNSGLIGLPEAVDNKILSKVLEVSDTISLQLPSDMYLSEQYAFSCVLSPLPNFCTAEECVLHYWNCSSELELETQHLSDSEFASLSEEALAGAMNRAVLRQKTFSNRLRCRFRKFKRSIRKRQTEMKAFWIRLRA